MEEDESFSGRCPTCGQLSHYGFSEYAIHDNCKDRIVTSCEFKGDLYVFTEHRMFRYDGEKMIPVLFKNESD